MEKEILLVCFIAILASVSGKKDYDFEYIKTVNMNENNDLFEYTVNVEQFNETAFKINAESELKIALDDEYTINIDVYHNEEGKEEFGEVLMALPPKKVCEFLKTTYKKDFYDRIKDTTNFPHFDTCPVEPNKFWMKDHIINGENYKAFAQPGLFKVVASITQEDKIRGGVEVYCLVKERAN